MNFRLTTDAMLRHTVALENGSSEEEFIRVAFAIHGMNNEVGLFR